MIKYKRIEKCRYLLKSESFKGSPLYYIFATLHYVDNIEDGPLG
jgi:hypothetical protein